MPDWYPRYPAHYERDTLHLSLAAHGAYIRLIDFYMQTEAPLPDDDRALARVLRCDLAEWLAVAEAVRPFFQARGGRLVHKRCETEIARQKTQAERIANRNRKNGAKGGRPKDSKNKALEPNGLEQETQENPHTYIHTYRQISECADAHSTGDGADELSWLDDRPKDPAPAGTAPQPQPEAAPKDPVRERDPPPDYSRVVEAWNAMAERNGLAGVQVLTDERRRSLKARLGEVGGVEGMLAAIEKVGASPRCRGQNRDGWIANFDFLLRRRNLTNVMEGHYDERTRPNGYGGSGPGTRGDELNRQVAGAAARRMARDGRPAEGRDG